MSTITEQALISLVTSWSSSLPGLAQGPGRQQGDVHEALGPLGRFAAEHLLRAEPGTAA